MKIISPDFLTSRLTVYEDEPLAEETVLAEGNALPAAAAPVVERTGAEVVPRQEVPSSAAVTVTEETTLETPTSGSVVEAGDTALQRTEVTADAASGEVPVVASSGAAAEEPKGSPEMRMLS